MRRFFIGVALFMVYGGLSGRLETQSDIQQYELPAGAQVIEVRSLKVEGYPQRALLLWMLTPKKYLHEPDNPLPEDG